MSGAMPALRWERGRDAYGAELWRGHSGAEWVAYVWPHVAPGVCRWSLALDSDGPPGDGGDAPTLDAAKAAAERAFAAWCGRAGLAPATPGAEGGEGAMFSPYKKGAAGESIAPDDAARDDAAAAVNAAAPVIRDVRHLVRAEHADRYTAAALAEALHALADRAAERDRAAGLPDAGGAASWLRGVADALDAQGVTP